MYDLPEEIDVAAEGPLRIITLNRPGALNAVNDALHTGLARLWPRLSEDWDARAAVLTGSGRAFSAGGDFGYLEELGRDPVLRTRTIAHGRDLVLGMARCRVPVVAAVNGPAVGLGCSLVALSDIVYIAPDAYLADPHVQVGLVAADGGPLTWPLHTSLHRAKEYARQAADAQAVGAPARERDEDRDVDIKRGQAPEAPRGLPKTDTSPNRISSPTEIPIPMIIPAG